MILFLLYHVSDPDTCTAVELGIQTAGTFVVDNTDRIGQCVDDEIFWSYPLKQPLSRIHLMADHARLWESSLLRR